MKYDELLQCPQCDRLFASEHSLKIHVSLAHKDRPRIWRETPKLCKGCRRQFSTKKTELADEHKYCRRATKYGGYCDDKRCQKIRRITPAEDVKITFKGVKSHCTEGRIKAVEKGWRDQ